MRIYNLEGVFTLCIGIKLPKSREGGGQGETKQELRESGVKGGKEKLSARRLRYRTHKS